MHQYRIEVFENDEQTGRTSTQPTVTRYADNPEQARLIYQEYDLQRWESNNWKRYTVKLHVLAYKLVTNAADFFAQFQS